MRGPVEPARAVQLAIQIADALDAAHAKGTVHCDLKPANILICNGRVKLLDFGIAKLVARPHADETVSVGESVMGTPGYMAPEQAQGDQPDARSDIFGFGAVLYELLAGRPAFEGESVTERLAAAVRDDPPPLSGPRALSRVLERCLLKQPAARFQTVAELKRALSAVSAADTNPKQGPPSLAVLPFKNVSSDPEQEYFSDGLTEEIINVLARVPGLKVIARTSAFAFKGQTVDIRHIANTLHVTHVLEGSVRRGGDRIPVTAQHIEVEDACHVWAERYDRELADVFSVQDDIASAIAQQLRQTLSGESTRRKYTPNIAAYEAYLMGRHAQWRLTPESLDQARQFYQHAIELDPAFALPYVGLAENVHIVASGRGPHAQAAADQMRQLAERALALDPTNAEAHAWLGVYATTYVHNWSEAARRFRLAMMPEPVPPRILHLRGYFYLRFIGEAAQAVDDHCRALQADPLSLITRVGLVMSLISAERSSEVAEESRRLQELDPDFRATYTLLAFDLRPAALTMATTFAERAYQLASWNAGTTGVLAGLCRRAGDTGRADALLRELGDPDVYGNPVDLALHDLASGETDQAVDHVLAGFRQRHPFVTMAVVGGPYGAALRASARWPMVAQAMRLPDDASQNGR